MSEESKAVKRAKRWEKAELERAARAYGRYLRAVEYRKLMEKQEEIQRETERITRETAELISFGERLRTDIDRAREGLPIIESRTQQ